MAKSTDETVLELLQKVKEQKEEIKKASSRPQWKTNCTIGYDPESSNRINIMTVRDQAKLVEIYMFLLSKELLWEQAVEELGVTVDPTYLGFSLDDWKADIKTRASALLLDDKKAALDKLDKRINSLVSAEQRRALELAAIQKEMGL